MEPPQTRPKKLLDQVRDAIRMKHYSYRTEETYVQWIRRYILFHDKRHPNEMGVSEIEAFLTHLAVQQNVAAATQNQALSALLFLYQVVLQMPLGGRIDAIRAKRSLIGNGTLQAGDIEILKQVMAIAPIFCLKCETLQTQSYTPPSESYLRV